MMNLFFLLFGRLTFRITPGRDLRWGGRKIRMGCILYRILPVFAKSITIYKYPKKGASVLSVHTVHFNEVTYTLSTNSNNYVHLCNSELLNVFGKIPDKIYFTYK